MAQVSNCQGGKFSFVEGYIGLKVSLANQPNHRTSVRISKRTVIKKDESSTEIYGSSNP